MLCWDVPVTHPGDSERFMWTQEFNTSSTQLPPGISLFGWRLNFTVSNNPDTDTFNNKVRGWVSRDTTNDSSTSSHPENLEGLYFTGIEDVGDYEIKFNMNGDTTDTGAVDENDNAIPWSIKHSTDNGTTWTDYSATASYAAVSSMTGWTDNVYGDKIGFMPTGSQEALSLIHI